MTGESRKPKKRKPKMCPIQIRGGRPTKLTERMKISLEKAYRLGLTDAEVAEIVGIDESLIYKWQKRTPKFFQLIKEDWKKKADSEIERSLRERANGYGHPETKAQWVQDENGGRWETLEMVKRYPPDPTSMIFWLKNRQPEKWRDKQEIDAKFAGTITHDLSPALTDLITEICGQTADK